MAVIPQQLLVYFARRCNEYGRRIERSWLLDRCFSPGEQLRDLASSGAFDLIYYRRLSEEGFADVTEKAVERIGLHALNFAFVYLEGADAMGHRHGWMSPEYLAAVRRQDELVAELLAQYRALGIEQDTLDNTSIKRLLVLCRHKSHSVPVCAIGNMPVQN